MFQEERTELKFEWPHLGDIEEGRPNLGPLTNVAVYRLMQFTLRDAAIEAFGVEATNRVFYKAGHMAGKAVYENLIGQARDLAEFVAKLQKILKELRAGIMRVEEADETGLRFTITVAEDLDCSGLPDVDEAICTYDEGLIAGLLEAFSGRPFEVREVDCWGTGERVCRFEAGPRNGD